MATYPDIQVGDDVTADLLTSMLPQYYQKTGSTTRASTTTFSADPDLVIPVLANGTYLMEFYVKYATTTAAGFKTDWDIPTGSSFNKNVQGLGTGSVDNTSASAAFRMGVHGTGTVISYGSRNDVSLQVWCYEWAIATIGSTAGNVSLRWAQVASTAVNTAVVGGSFARATRLG